jgi:hypothetical protein
VSIVLALQRAAFVENQKSRPPRLLVVPNERLTGTAGDARIRETAGTASRKRIGLRNKLQRRIRYARTAFETIERCPLTELRH